MGNNYNHLIGVQIHKALMGLRVEHFQAERESITVETIETHISGNERTGRWPMTDVDRAFL